MSGHKPFGRLFTVPLTRWQSGLLSIGGRFSTRLNARQRQLDGIICDLPAKGLRCRTWSCSLKALSSGLSGRHIDRRPRLCGFSMKDLRSWTGMLSSRRFELSSAKLWPRLESKGVPHTFLTDEWSAICETAGAEREFCETAGALGLDPYDLEDKTANQICSIAKRLPVEMRREFFLAADSALLTQQARWISKCLRQLENYETKTKLAGEKGRYRTQARSSTPWQSGYDLARKFRRDFGLGSPSKPLGIDKLCGLKKGNLPVIRVGDEHQLDAVARVAADLGPQVATSKERESSRSYLFGAGAL